MRALFRVSSSGFRGAGTTTEPAIALWLLQVAVLEFPMQKIFFGDFRE
jgi:hypothetical protein